MKYLGECWPILLMLLLVNTLASLLAHHLTVNALFREEAGARLDLHGLLVSVQRICILLALLSALIGQTRVLYWTFVLTISLVTLGLASNIMALIATFRVQPVDDALQLLQDGFMLWLMNLLVFAVWYWLIDTGGRSPRHRVARARQDLLFPQQAIGLPAWEGWRPHPVDYLFVAFTTNTSFSPNDTQFLTRRARLLMMGQALIALVIVAVIFARGVNALQ